MSVNKLVISRLFESFGELERAISSAKATLASRENPPQELLDRVESYESILSKQRKLAESLCTHVNKGAWDEVDRHIRIINGLSQMIRDDAREVVSGLRPNLTREERELMLS